MSMTILDFDRRAAHIKYLEAAGRVLIRTDRILSGREDLSFSIAEEGPAPAWSDGAEITIRSTDWARSWKDRGAGSRLLGLNYHELCHVIFTPRDGSNAYSMVELADAESEYDLALVYNLAEDQRIETLFCTMYHPAAAFFTQAVTDLIIGGDAGADNAWFLIAGRKYLPVKLRQASKAAFRGGDADAFQALIDEYLVLDWGSDPTRGVELLVEIAEFMDAAQVGPPAGCGTPAPSKGSPNTEAEDEAREAVQDQMDAEAEDEGDSQGEADEGTDEAEGADTPGDGTEAEEDTTEDEGEQAQSGTAESGDAPEASPEGSKSTDLAEALVEAQTEAAVQTEADGEQAESQIDLELEHLDAPLGDSFPPHAARVPVSDAARAISGELEGVLAELRSLVDPGWIYRQNRGRLSADRYLRREAWEPMDEVFDLWSQGAEDALDIEIALLVDTSSSMQMYRRHGDSPAQQVAEGAWALKRALDVHGIKCAVLAFDSNTYTVYGEFDESDPDYMPQPLAQGGTDPTRALIEVGKHFRFSDHKRRILVVLTDGQFVKTSYWDRAKPRSEDNSIALSDLVAGIDAEIRIKLAFGSKADLSQQGFDEVRQITHIDEMVEAVRDTIVDGVLRSGILENSWI